MAKIKLTENKLRQIVSESVKKLLNELNWKTYANAAQKSQNEERREKFKQAAIDAFNREHGYNNPSTGDATELTFGDDFWIKHPRLKHTVNGKTYTNYGDGKLETKDDGWYAYHLNDKHIMNATPRHARTIQGAEDAFNAYTQGHSKYVKGQGWVNDEDAPKTDWHDYKLN